VFSSSKSIIIIIGSIVALIALQGLWLLHVVESEKQNLSVNTRLSALSALNQLEQKENLMLLVKNLDTVIDFSGIKVTKTVKRHPKVNVFLSSNSRVITINNTNGGKSYSQAYSIHTNGENGTTQSITTTSESEEIVTSIEKKVDDKVKSYEALLKKIAIQTKYKNRNVLERISFDTLGLLLNQALEQRGINLKAEYAIFKNKDSLIKASPLFHKESSFVALPMFVNDVVQQNYVLQIMFNRSWLYYYRKSVVMICVSVAITLLLITFIILLYRRMRNEQLLNQYKNDFINNLTHELKTPLATISLANTNIQTHAKYNGDDRTLQYTGIVSEEAQRLNNHIENVLALSFLEKNEQVLQFTPHDIHQLIHSLEKSLSDMCRLKNGKLSVSLNAAHTSVNVDVSHLSNCLYALIDNALKYCKAHPEIHISTTNYGSDIRIAIKDNGPGIAKEYQQKVFEKFFRITEKNLHTTKGFGLGLSYVKQVIEMMGGSVELNSEFTRGSEFIICLPYAKT
jgi:two-component system, OmpR family, phosphate regulon sensor histidine kinase PhoR